ncbi:hypothetical protein [Desulfovibrio sp. ZJ200]|uniref:hypothetical protein n=1 Tax=Desulfovibrio sp. ZJ200 TaxID=2709792 RepID=UPI0013ECE708|nr:hypothetical protein [Desulfovibrio sp. ZJ200]
MPLYKPNSNPAALAQSAMSNATQAAASQTRQTTVNVKKESNFWDDLYKGAAALNMGARAVGGMVDAVEDVKGMYDEYKVRDAYDAMSKAYTEGGIEALQTNPDFQDYHHAQAFGRIMKDRAASEKGRMEMLQNARKIAEQNYNDVRAVLMPGLEAYKSGDMNTFSDSMVKASQVVNMPYRIEPAGDGNYKLFFRSDAKGGWTDTGRKMTGQEVFEMGRNYLRGEINVLSGMGMKLTPYNQQQVLEGMRRAMATNDTNVENMADYSRHIPLLNANGRIVGMAIPQNPLDGSKNTEYDAYGMNGKPLGRFDVQGILQRGMRFGNMVQKSGRGASVGKVGPGGSNAHIAMLNAGYVWDKDQKWYFKAGADADGKPQADYSQPASVEIYQKAVRQAGGFAQGIGGVQANDADPWGWRTPPSSQQQRPAPPNIPRREAAPSKSPNAGQLVMYSKNGASQWAIIGEDGRPQEITPEEANAYSRRLAGPEPAPRRRADRVTIHDVWDELSPEEREDWQKTGKLPGRYNQVR